MLLNYSEARTTTTTNTSNTTKSKSKRRRKAAAAAEAPRSKGSRFGTTVKAAKGRGRSPRESSLDKDVSAKPRWWIRVQKALYTAATCCVKCLGPVWEKNPKKYYKKPHLWGIVVSIIWKACAESVRARAKFRPNNVTHITSTTPLHAAAQPAALTAGRNLLALGSCCPYWLYY